MGKQYEDEYEQEAEYKRWLYYRESSHEERALKRKPADSHKKQNENEPVDNVFHDYPEHQRMIAEAERKYLESQMKNTDLQDDSESN